MVENSLEIPEGWGGYHCYPKMENPKGWGVLYEIPSVVGVWIFSGITHFVNHIENEIFLHLTNLYLNVEFERRLI